MSIHKNKLISDETICALATPAGTSAIAVIRVSGEQTFGLVGKVFKPRKSGLTLAACESHTIHLGDIRHNFEIIDEVLISVFKEPNSYTGENALEISCHGSEYIQQKIIEILIEQGIRLAKPGEFTQRAFLNNKLDLSQAEAVADLIASHSKASHDLAIKQMRGEFSNKIKQLRKQLVDFASLLELELDFSEEDVQFANRDELSKLLKKLENELSLLVNSFSLGNVLKKGIPVAIIGEPNVGKSTLLNAILNEERAIVSDIPGTTRDAIEDVIVLNGVSFRFIDTAGLRTSQDKIETIGIEKTLQKIDQSKIILYVFDVSKTNCNEIQKALEEFNEHISKLPENIMKDKRFILIANKTDLLVEAPRDFKLLVEMECIFVSAKRKENINLIMDNLAGYIESERISDATMVSNLRHFEALKKSLEAVVNTELGFEKGLSSDLLAIDIRQALHYLGEITGEITTDEILGNIFSKFCIGK